MIRLALIVPGEHLLPVHILNREDLLSSIQPANVLRPER